MSSSLSTHVLDLETGNPAAGIAVSLGRGDTTLASAVTDDDGRIGDWGVPIALQAGDYWLQFDTGSWRAATGSSGFHPRILIDFSVADPDRHYHVPLLLSPYGYSTYRGS